MTDKHEALIFADDRRTSSGDDLYEWAIDAEDWIRRLHAENTTLQQGYAAARLEIESLKAQLHIGDSAFESWYSTYNPTHKGDKQRARDAYAAGMGDSLVMAAPAAVAGPSEMPTVPDSVLAYVHTYGDSRADEDGLSGMRVSELILALRRWAKSIASAPAAQEAPKQGAPAMPSGWVSCTIEFDGSGPEEVAYGPKIMMDRLAKWLGKHFERTIAEKAAPQPSPASQGDALDTARLDWLDKNIFYRDMPEWDAKYVHDSAYYSMWVLFAPKVAQGSARKIIDAARAAQEGK